MIQENNKLLNISFWFFIISISLLPLFFIPGSFTPVFFAKTLLISLGVSVSFLLFFIRFLKLRQISVPSPKNLVFLSPVLIILTTLLSSLFSSQKTLSMIGYGFEVGTFAFIFLFFVVFFLTVFLLPLRKNSSLKAITLIVFVFIILSVFQILKIIFNPGFLSFGIFQEKIGTPLGSWSELAFFSGAILLLSVFFLDRNKRNNQSGANILLIISLVFSLIFLILINNWTAWFLTFITLSVFMFFQFFNQFKLNRESLDNLSNENKVYSRSFDKSFLAFSLPVLFITLIFILPFGGFFSSYLNNFLGTSYFDVKPTLSSTFDVFSQTLKEGNKNFLFGSGPNSFLFQWRKFKPIEVNQTEFWSTEFQYGSGLLPTIFITSGFLGTLFWLIFLLSFFWLGIKYIIKNPNETFSVAFLFLAAFFWISIIVYPVSHTLFIFTAFFSGIFITSLSKNSISFLNFSPQSKPSANMSLILILIVFLVMSLWSGLLFFKKTLSARNFNHGVSVLLQGDIKQAESRLLRAQSLSSNDVISRYLSEIYLLESSQMVQVVNNPTDQDIAAFQGLLQSSKNYAESSILLNPRSFENWFQLARFYEFIRDLVPEQLNESVDNARMSYEGAEIFDPKNPLINLMNARLEFSAGNLSKAEELVNESLSKKSNYSEAIFLLSRIKALQGNLEGAIDSAKEVINLNSREPSNYFQLGLLLYQNSEFKSASEALNQALLLEPEYANARYFFGLSLAKIGDSKNAIKQFEILSQSHPQNIEISEILSNLKSGQTNIGDSSGDDSGAETELPIEE